MYAVTIGTTSWRYAEALAAGEVEYPGVPGPNMIWSDTIGNMRPMTPAEIAAQPAQQATAYAKAEKAAATASVDDALKQSGNRAERGIMSVALSISSAVNNDRQCLGEIIAAILAAATLADLKTRVGQITVPAQVTPAQVGTAVKSAIAQTPE